MPNVGLYTYMTLAFLALLGAPYIYDISSLRVKLELVQTVSKQRGKYMMWQKYLTVVSFFKN